VPRLERQANAVALYFLQREDDLRCKKSIDRRVEQRIIKREILVNGAELAGLGIQLQSHSEFSTPLWLKNM
jgi:hypothetical protein